MRTPAQTTVRWAKLAARKPSADLGDGGERQLTLPTWPIRRPAGAMRLSLASESVRYTPALARRFGPLNGDMVVATSLQGIGPGSG
jgi:hypothetical protein